jgi:hypothetical protein
MRQQYADVSLLLKPFLRYTWAMQRATSLEERCSSDIRATWSAVPPFAFAALACFLVEGHVYACCYSGLDLLEEDLFV